ncbi:MAG: TRAP transporter fused permease subunit, partial [Pseudoflavonifractor sp.]
MLNGQRLCRCPFRPERTCHMKEKLRSGTLHGVSAVLLVACLVASLFHIFIAWDTSITIVQQRVFHVFIILFIYFLLQAKDRLEKGKKSSVLLVMIALVVAGLAVYFLVNTTLPMLQKHGISGATMLDIVMGVALILLVLYIAWRTVGWALAALSLVFIAYALLGPIMPNIIAHKGYTVPYITNYVAWTSESIFGSCIGACVSFVALYIIFGELLEKFGAGQFFIDVAYALTGRMKGGPAEASVVSSALMGSINGSAVANVVTTGTFTIPLMKKVGYTAEFAGAVEAVASTGGQLLPPVMGAAAFVMADMTGIPYSTIIIAAIIPGVLYYLSLGISVYLEADKLGIQAEPAQRLPQLKKVLKEGWYYGIPIAVLIFALLGMGYSANFSALYAIGALLVVGVIKELVINKRFPWREIFDSLVSAAKTTVPVSIACACAGIVIGIVSMTGIGVKFTSIVFQLSGGNLFLMLLMIMLACIVMGMGLPSTAAYIIAASI